jgi:hypothetical protein
MEQKVNKEFLFDPNTLAKERFPVSTAALFRSPVFLPWVTATDLMLRDYESIYKPWRTVEIVDRKGNQIEAIEVDAPLWRRHKNLMNILFSNLIPFDDENGCYHFVFTAGWMASQLGYEQPNKRAADIDKLIYQLQKAKFRYRFKNTSGTITTGMIDETEKITEADVEKYGLPASALGMRRVSVKKKWVELFEIDNPVVMMPGTSKAIAAIPDGAWQSLVEIALSHKDFFNQRLETSKDGSVIGVMEMIGFNKKEMTKSAYSKQRKRLVTSSDSSSLAANLAGVVIEDGAEGFVVRRIDQHNKVGRIIVMKTEAD